MLIFSTLLTLLAAVASSRELWIPERTGNLTQIQGTDNPRQSWYPEASVNHFGLLSFPPPRCTLHDGVKYFKIHGHTEIEQGAKVLEFAMIVALSSGKGKTTIYELPDGYSEGRITKFEASFNTADVGEPENFTSLPLEENGRLLEILNVTFVLGPNQAVFSVPREHNTGPVARFLFPWLADVFLAPHTVTNAEHHRHGDEFIDDSRFITPRPRPHRWSLHMHATSSNVLDSCYAYFAAKNELMEGVEMLAVNRTVHRSCMYCGCFRNEDPVNLFNKENLGMQSFINAAFEENRANVENKDYIWNLAYVETRRFSYAEGNGVNCTRGIIDLHEVTRRNSYWPNNGGCFAKNGMCPHKYEPYFQEVVHLKAMTPSEMEAENQKTAGKSSLLA